MKSSAIWIIVVLVLAVVVLGVALTRDSSDSMGDDGMNDAGGDNSDAVMDNGLVDENPDVTFVLTGENFKFVMGGVDNPELRVKQGDIVKIEFTSISGFHDWKVDEFDAATAQVRDTDGMTSVTFVADQVGTFEYYCSVGQHRANGMKGMLVVE